MPKSKRSNILDVTASKALRWVLTAGSRINMTADYAISWSFVVALTLPDGSTASCPVPKSQMTDFPMQMASPTTIEPIITTIPMPSQLSDVENIAGPQGQRRIFTIVHSVEERRKLQCQTTCAQTVRAEMKRIVKAPKKEAVSENGPYCWN